MRQITDIDELRHIQLDILSFVDRICRDNGIIYSLAGGSMLGAVRHKGYIPWDDDIDIFMPRKDYELFIGLMKKLSHPYYRILTTYDTPGFCQPYANISDDRTIVEEPGIGNEAKEGVNIDIFPVDFVPEDEHVQKKIVGKILLLRNLFIIKGLKWDSRRGLLKNLLAFICQILIFPISRKWLSVKMDSISSRAESNYSKKSAVLVWGNGIKIMNTYIYENYQDWPFENNVFRGVVDYSSYLSSLYGNWRALPPKDKQVSHHKFTAYWKD